MAEIEEFESRQAMTRAAARAVVDVLTAKTQGSGRASMACSGGTSPISLYEALSGEASLPWERIDVTLADERDAPDGAEARNDLLVRQHLLRGPARHASFTPLVGTDRLPPELLPLSVAVMGMGEDGHTASWFPTSPGLSDALEGADRDVVRVVPDPMPENAPYERLSLTRAAITHAGLTLLLVTGEKKRAVLDEAMRHGQVETMPVRALIHAREANLRILYAA